MILDIKKKYKTLTDHSGELQDWNDLFVMLESFLKRNV